MFKKSKQLRRNFSLIELLIVIGIMGALTALILPQFQNAEDNAKDSACDYNNSGTLRFVTMFKAANGVYPTGFHTGMDGANVFTVGEGDTDYGVDPTAANMSGMTTKAALTDAGDGTAEYLTSMKESGIVTLASGTGEATDIASVPVCQIASTDSAWSEDSSGGTVATTNIVTFGGKTLPELAAANGIKQGDGAGVIVPLFVASTVDWEKAYKADGTEKGDSYVNIALEGKCPWPADGKFRYYICFFKAYADGTPAKLVGTACPECGPLHAGNF
jgi:type IV pilus assembly protein PilA